MNRFYSRIGTQAGLFIACLWLFGCDWALPDAKQPRPCVQPAGNISFTVNQLRVDFSLGEQVGTVDAIRWNFGDGRAIEVPASQTTVSHDYTISGPYTVTATLTNSCRNEKVVTSDIVVTDVVDPTVVLDAVAQNYTSATVTMRIANTGKASLTRYGVCWSATSQTPRPDRDSLVEGTVLNPALNTPITIPIPRLKAGTTYWFSAFATNAGGRTGYSLSPNAKTNTYPDVVITDRPTCPTNDCYTTAKVNLRVNDSGSPQIAQYGLVYSSTNPLPELNRPDAQFEDVPGLQTGVTKTVELRGLTSGRTYSIRPYARLANNAVRYGASQTYTTTSSLLRDLVLFLPFDGADLTDKSGFRNNATDVPAGGPDFITDRKGNSEGAIKLNGVRDYFFIADSPSLQADTELSISIWIRPDVLDTMQIYNKSRFNTSTAEQYSSKIVASPTTPFQINTDIKQGSNCEVYKDWQTFKALFDNTPMLGRWNHLVFTYKGRVASMYLNGVLLSRKPDLPATSIDRCVGGELKFGAQVRDYPDFFKGAMDDIRLYRRELSAAEVQELYRQ